MAVDGISAGAEADHNMLPQPTWSMSAKRQGPVEEITAGSSQEDAKKSKTKEDEDKLVKNYNNKEMSIMVTIMAKLLLQNTQTIRDISGVVWFTFIHLASTDFVKLTQEAGVKYAETVKGLGGSHTMGPPHVHKWLAAVVATIKHKKIIENEPLHKQIVKYHSDSLAGASIDQVAASVKFFKVKPIYKGKDKKESEVRIHLALANHKLKTEDFDEGEDIDLIFVKAFLAMGMTQKLGPGPPGQMERLVQQWLEKSKKK